jgi:hypothetical protein
MDTPAIARRKPAATANCQLPTANSIECPRESIPASTPSFKSFAHIRNPKVRRAKEYEQHLLFMRDSFPEYSAGIEKQIAYARSQAERGRASDHDQVLKQMESCALSCREISDDLSIPYATVYKILQEYAAAGVVIIRQHAGRAGNKPVCYYSLSHAQTL